MNDVYAGIFLLAIMSVVGAIAIVAAFSEHGFATEVFAVSAGQKWQRVGGPVSRMEPCSP